MKMAKKVLSVVLAVVMALSCFAVAGSAFGPGASATANAKIKLLAAVGKGTCYLDDESYENVVTYEDPQTEKSNEVTAKAGDTVYIYVYGSTDYPVFSFSADVFYPAIFKTPTQVYLDSVNAIDPSYVEYFPGLLSDEENAIFFGQSDLIKEYGVNADKSIANEWDSDLDAANKTNVAKAWPTDEEGKIIEGFGSNTTPSSDWKFARFAEIIINGKNAVVMNGESYTYRLPLHIPEGTPDGTYTVTVPEQAAAQATKPLGFTRLAKLKATYFPPTKSYKNPDYINPEWEYDANGTVQNFDFSEATVTIKVGEDTPTPPTPLTWDALQSAYDDAILLDEEDYTISSWDESNIEDALANAEEALNDQEIFEGTQEDIDALEDALTNAMDALDERVDTANLEAALSDSAVINKDDYVDDAKWTAFENAVKAGTELMENAADTSADDQEIFDNAAQAIFDAITALNPALADYTEYDKAVAAANTAFTKTDWYSEGSLETLSGVMNTYGSLSKDYLKKDQDTVDAATKAINDAVGALALLPATDAYEALKDSIDKYDKLTETDYTPASWRDFAAALAEAKQFYETTPWVTQKAEDEAKYSEFIGIVEAVKVDLDEARSYLDEAGKANYEELDGIIGDFYELNEDAYTSDSWGDVENYIDNEIDYELNENFQDTINDEYIPTLLGLISDLEFEEFTITYDYYVGEQPMAEELADKVVNSNKTTYTYDENDVVISKANISLDGYTCESVDNTGWDAETTTGDKTVKVTFSKNEAAQHSITYNYVDEVGDPVFATTTKPATFKEDESITFTAADFTAVSSNYEFKSVNPTTIAEGTTTDVTVTVTFALKDADYADLDDAIKAAEAKKEYQYTAESWTPFAEALADAKKVDRTLKITDQDTVDAAKDLLNAKMDALVIAVNGSVYDVDYTPVKGQLSNTFEIKIDGRAMMIQFQELSHGEGTRSYDRYNEEHVSIVSYNKDGEVVSDYSKDIAYEIWTVTTRIDGPEIGIRVKNNGSSKWETPDKAYKFTYEKVEVKADIISAELVATSGPQGGVAATVVAGPDAERVMFKMEDGSTATMYAKNATPDQDGNLVFTGKAFMNHEGLNTITIRVLADNKWTTSETTLTYTADPAKK